jgi:hypothetical protein
MIAPTVLDHLFEPWAGLAPSAAQAIVDLRLDTEVQSKLDELAARANRGELSPEDRQLYEQYVEGLDVLAVIKSKARAALRRAAHDGCGDA